uniref:Uncharacterized protein n=1 Tax=Arundo donax TaxID=35708 RepID=A0A0A9EI16_ARUDO
MEVGRKKRASSLCFCISFPFAFGLEAGAFPWLQQDCEMELLQKTSQRRI